MGAPSDPDLINGAHAAAVAPESTAPEPPAMTREMRAGIGKFRHALQLSFGQIVLATMNLPRYRHQTLADLAHLFLEPLMRDRVAIAKRTSKTPDGAEEEQVAGIALWATVSDAVDARIAEQIKAGVFPVRLGADDWTSGETVWLLDVVAADRRQATSVLANFRQLAGGRAIKIAPLVARLIDPEVAAKLRGAAEQAAFPEPRGQA
jgi:hemolysin-activating ACP:hemolysin acyltransferase